MVLSREIWLSKIDDAIAQHSAFLERYIAQVSDEFVDTYGELVTDTLDYIMLLMSHLTIAETTALLAGNYETDLLKEIELTLSELDSDLQSINKTMSDNLMRDQAMYEQSYIIKLLAKANI